MFENRFDECVDEVATVMTLTGMMTARCDFSPVFLRNRAILCCSMLGKSFWSSKPPTRSWMEIEHFSLWCA